jgi:hypothetical protein
MRFLEEMKQAPWKIRVNRVSSTENQSTESYIWNKRRFGEEKTVEEKQDKTHCDDGKKLMVHAMSGGGRIHKPEKGWMKSITDLVHASIVGPFGLPRFGGYVVSLLESLFRVGKSIATRSAILSDLAKKKNRR